MISDFISLDKKLNIPLYQQIYNTIKKSIENGSLRDDEKLPSVRKLCSDLGVSKTTVETAYNLLCAEGYIINYPQKGYYVEKGLFFETKTTAQSQETAEEKVYYKYDFSGKGIDNRCSNVKEWRKYVKDILNKEYLLNTYSENQGEKELRQAIAKYAFATKGVTTDYHNIVIGSGSQTLLYILGGIIGVGKSVAIEENFFPQAEQVFRSFDYEISYTKSDTKGVSLESIEEIKPDLLMINPNHNTVNGIGISVSRKLDIIKLCKKFGIIIIEDDYNGELRYRTHSKASMQSISPETTVYIGSFSKVLLPSVRISYMILPDRLAEKYRELKENYNQTTSKIEQLALARYLNDMKLEKHLRKARRYYNSKSKYMSEVLSKYFDKFTLNETSMYFEIPIECKNTKEKLSSESVKIMSTSTDRYIRLNFSQIDSDLIEEGISKVKKCTSV